MIKLRRLDRADEDLILSWRNRDDIRRWMFSDHVITPVEHNRWLENFLSDPLKRGWLIQADGNPIGFAQVTRNHEDLRVGILGIYIAEVGVKGAGSEALRLVLLEIFESLFVDSLIAETLEDNEKAKRLYRLVGMQECGFKNELVTKDGVDHRVLVFEIRKSVSIEPN